MRRLSSGAACGDGGRCDTGAGQCNYSRWSRVKMPSTPRNRHFPLRPPQRDMQMSTFLPLRNESRIATQAQPCCMHACQKPVSVRCVCVLGHPATSTPLGSVSSVVSFSRNASRVVLPLCQITCSELFHCRWSYPFRIVFVLLKSSSTLSLWSFLYAYLLSLRRNIVHPSFTYFLC